jgi:hypothetical protein
MKKINGKLSYALYFILVAFFITSCKRVELEQDVTIAKVCDNTMYVSTKVRTYNWIGMPHTLEYYELERVSADIVDSIKDIEYNKATPIYNTVKSCY